MPFFTIFVNLKFKNFHIFFKNSKSQKKQIENFSKNEQKDRQKTRSKAQKSVFFQIYL